MRISRDYPTEGTRAGERGAGATARTSARERGWEGGGEGDRRIGRRGERGRGRGALGQGFQERSPVQLLLLPVESHSHDHITY